MITKIETQKKEEGVHLSQVGMGKGGGERRRVHIVLRPLRFCAAAAAPPLPPRLVAMGLGRGVRGGVSREVARRWEERRGPREQPALPIIMPRCAPASKETSSHGKRDLGTRQKRAADTTGRSEPGRTEPAPRTRPLHCRARPPP